VLEASLIIPLGIASDRSSPAAFRLALTRAGDLKVASRRFPALCLKTDEPNRGLRGHKALSLAWIVLETRLIISLQQIEYTF
jgi:hypothetical protein